MLTSDHLIARAARLLVVVALVAVALASLVAVARAQHPASASPRPATVVRVAPVDPASATVDGLAHVPAIACGPYGAHRSPACVDGWTGTTYPATALVCQYEEGGEVIAYPVSMAPRPGFDRVACP